MSLFERIQADKKPLDQKILDKATDSTSLFDRVKETVSKNMELVDDLILKKYKFDKLINSKKLDWYRKEIADFLSAAEARGMGIVQVDEGNFQTEDKPSKLGLHRQDDRVQQIIKLQDTKWKFKFAGKIDRSLPTLEELNINEIVESPKRNCNHLPFDVETDKHMKPIAMGALHLEAKRYIRWKKSETPEIKLWELNNGYYIEIFCRDPLEALFIADIENVYAQVLLSAIAQNQLSLIEILKEIAIPNIPFDFNILEGFLYHRNYTIYMAHNAKFDVNLISNEHKLCRKEGFQFLMPRIEPKTIRLNFGKNSYTQEGYLQEFKIKKQYDVKLGNVSAGFRFAIKHQTAWNWLGVPQISLYPIQEGSNPSSFALDTLLLAMSIQFQKPKEATEITSSFGLDAISYGTPYEKIKLDKEKKVFTLEDFTISKDGELSEQEEYLLYDNFSLISAYASLTQQIPYEKLHEVLGLSMSSYFGKPLTSRLISTATLAKDILFKFLEKETFLQRKQIENNIEKERHFLTPFEKIERIRMEKRKRKVEKISTYSGGRIEAHVYGKVVPIDGKTIEFSDFKSQYPHHSRLICAALQYIEGAKGILHKRIVQEQKAVENNVWNIVRLFKRDYDAGVLTEDPYPTINGIIKVKSKTKLQIRFKVSQKGRIIKKNDHLIKGEFPTTISDLVGAILRKHYLSGISISQLRKKIEITSGMYLKFKRSEIQEHGKEYFTKLYVLRDANRHIPTLEQMIKIIMNASYGIASEGISKEDYTGKLFLPSIANGITSTARLSNTIAEIKTYQEKGQPLITHTDSVVSLALPETHARVSKLFSQIDPLAIETEAPIEWISILGKAKYGLKDINGKLKVLTHGSGAFGATKVKPAYEKMMLLLNDEEYTVSDAAEISKHRFPLFHQVNVKNNYKWKFNDKRKQHSGIRKIRELMENGDLIDEFPYKGVHIYLHEKTIQLKTKIKREYLFTTLPELKKGMFFDNATFGIVRIVNATPYDSEDMCAWLLTQQIPEDAYKHLDFHLTSRKKAKDHLQKRFWFDEARYSRKVEPKYEKMKEKLLARRLETKKATRKKIEGSISTHVFRNLTDAGYVLMQIKDKEPFIDVPEIPLIADKNYYQSDGFTFSGFCNLPQINVTEWQQGNLNKSYTDALINMGRTVSVKFAQIKYKDDPEKLAQKIKQYRFHTNVESLPFPKKDQHVYINSQIIPIHENLEDKQILKENIPFDMEKWVLDVIFTRDQLNVLIMKGTLAPIDEALMRVLKPRALAKKYETYQSKASLDFPFLGYKWYYILKSYNSLDANSYMHVYIIVGKNRTLNYKFHLNPTSKRMINFSTMKINKTTLQEDSGFIKDIMVNLFDGDFLASFGQNRSLTITDMQLKEKAPEIATCIGDVCAQTNLLTKLPYSRTKLSELHITTDIKAINGITPEDLKLAMHICSEIMQKEFNEEAVNGTNGDKEELKFRQNFQVSRARTNKGIYFQNYTTGRANVMYPKDRIQLANKYVRRSLRKKVDPNILKYVTENATDDVIRVECQIRGFDAINDPYEYESHDFFVDWVNSVLLYIQQKRKKTDNFSLNKGEIMAINSKPFRDFIKQENERSRLWQPCEPKPPD